MKEEEKLQNNMICQDLQGVAQVICMSVCVY